MPSLPRYGLVVAFLVFGFSQASAEISAPTVMNAKSEPSASLSSGRKTFMRKAETDMQAWSVRFRGLSDRALTKSKAVNAASDRELHVAWANTQTAAHGLRTATAKRWQKAKAFYKNKEQALQDAWRRFHPA